MLFIITLSVTVYILTSCQNTDVTTGQTLARLNGEQQFFNITSDLLKS